MFPRGLGDDPVSSGASQGAREERRRASSAGDIKKWEKNAPAPDSDAVYAARIEVDLDKVSPHVSGPDYRPGDESLADIEGKTSPIQQAYLLSSSTAVSGSRGRDAGDQGKESGEAASALRLRGEQGDPAGRRGEQRVEGPRRGRREDAPRGLRPCIGLGTGLLEPGEVGISATNRNFKGRMGSRDAKAYLASPEVVAASAVAGYITGPVPSDGRRPKRVLHEMKAAGGGG